jgi:L-arabinose isomerase
MESNRLLRVGLCGIGLDAYWPQFAGLKARLEGYVAEAAARLARDGVEVVNLGLVDSPQSSVNAGRQCRRKDVDILFFYVTTYALSNTVLPLVQRAGVPVIVLNLQPEAAIDYRAFNRLEDRTAMTGEWLAFCSACPVPEIANLFARARIPFHQVTGVLNEERTWTEIEEWLSAARVRAALADARLGLMGHYYSGMLDIMTDVTLVSIVFGSHIELLEVDELSALRPMSLSPHCRAEWRNSLPSSLCSPTVLATSCFALPEHRQRWTHSLRGTNSMGWHTITRARAMQPMKTR